MLRPRRPLLESAGDLDADDYEQRDRVTGTINGWSLTFQRPIFNTGLGEQGSDSTAVSFQVFTLSPSNTVFSSEEWTPVGPASEFL